MPEFDPSIPSRFVIGIDLGTTNSALAYVDSAEKTWRVHDFLIPQIVGPSLIERRDVLLSFHYQAIDGEFPANALRLPWDPQDPKHAVGVFARDHGADVPGRLIVSAKSWLCHPGVDRTAALLPWHGANDAERLSPVQASARYLEHLRRTWDQAHPDYPLAEQDAALTVPASFDEVARELTVEAAAMAGFKKIVLVEEPQAAFYAWIHSQGDDWHRQVQAGQKILVCDVGGGTSDFTLIQVRAAENRKVLFHRVAVGEHLILGGDNLDLALAHFVELRMIPGGKLSPRQWSELVRKCQKAKEALLSKDAPASVTVSVAGGGSKLIASALHTEVTRDEVIALLVDGFLPVVPLDAKPASRRSGFQEFGLPYAPDPAITKYLAAFLTAHGGISPSPGTPGEGGGEGDFGTPSNLAITNHPHPNPLPEYQERGPDIILFNGGLFESPVVRQRLLDVLSAWFSVEPVVLRNDRLDLAVARGAAYYGMVRRGLGVRISGGTAHSYYIGVDVANKPAAVCLLPAGVEEGHGTDLTDRTFDLLIRQPAEFPLYVSSVRTTDKPGQLVEIDPQQMTVLPPIRTVLQSGRKAAADMVKVTLHARRTEIGTLELWCQEAGGDRRWKLQFDVRATVRPLSVAAHDGTAEAEGVVDETTIAACVMLIREAFSKTGKIRPESLAKRLEQETEQTRLAWPSSLLRSFWETMMEVESSRRISIDHEARWLNFTGFCLRPGFGLAVDDWRVRQTWRLFPSRTVFLKNELCRAEWWILWRRVAGGLADGQQKTLVEPLLASLRDRLRHEGLMRQGGKAIHPPGPRDPAFQFGPHETAEVFRLLGSLEQLSPDTKTELGELLLEYLMRDRPAAVRAAAVWAIGRLGARVPVYGPLNALIPSDTAAAWASRLGNVNNDAVPFAIVQLTRRTGDRYRDVADESRSSAMAWLESHNAASHFVDLVRLGGALEADEQKIAFGEALPRGLRIE